MITESNGKLIVLEGIDGTGKTTLSKRLVEYLNKSGIPSISRFEPTDRTWGKKLRESFTSKRLSPAEELELFYLDRKDHVENIIKPALNEGKSVVLDRYYYSSMAYQGTRGYKTPGEIYNLMSEIAVRPDLMLLIEISIDTALNRIQQGRGDIPNLLEKRDNLERVHATFAAMDFPEIRRINGEQTLEEVFEEVKSHIHQLLDFQNHG